LFLNPDKVELEERTLARSTSTVQALPLTANVPSAFPQYLSQYLLTLASLVQHWQVWFAALFLVSVPVFFEAPLVRYAPWLSLICTVGWLAIAKHLQADPQSQTWGRVVWGGGL
jgi:hypothetical protein